MDTGAHLSCSALSMCREQMVSRVVAPSQCWRARCEHLLPFGAQRVPWSGQGEMRVQRLDCRDTVAEMCSPPVPAAITAQAATRESWLPATLRAKH